MSGRTRRPTAALAPERCACGRMTAEFDAVRETAVCPVCARTLGGGQW